jgi:hypothetical protein
VCWLLTEDMNEQDSSKRFMLNSVSMPDERIIARSYVVINKTMPYFKESKNHQINLVGDRVWTILPDSNIEARNILTGEVCETTQSITMRFPKLKDKVKQMKVFSLGQLGFHMIDLSSNKYFYEISSSILYEKKQWEIYCDSILKFKEIISEEKNLLFQNSNKKVISNFETKKIEIMDLKNEKMIEIQPPQNIPFDIFERNNFIVFFQNQLQIQDKNSVKFAFGINPASGKVIWQERADSIFNRMLLKDLN